MPCVFGIPARIRLNKAAMKLHRLKVFQFKTILSMFAIAALVTACGSDPDPEPTPVEKVTQQLTANGGTWTPAASAGVTIDGVDMTEDLFSGFSITFHEGTFTTTGTSPVWLREDTWRFKDQTATVIIRGQDNKEVAIEEISATQLKLTLEWTTTTSEGGRKASLKGKHEFILNK